MASVLRVTVFGTAVVFLIFSVLQLERERRTVTTNHILTEAGPITLYAAVAGEGGPLVLISHGFAGSRQMMQYIARDLARAGFRVASFDYIGHGYNTEQLSPDVTRIKGTTQQLIDQTLSVYSAVERLLGPQVEVAVLGHSMATDIIIRAARDMPQVRDAVAISMYSEAVTAEFPQRLLVISGEWEGRLRKAGRDVVAQVAQPAEEGQTVRSGDVVRRAIYAPRTEHVAVLFDKVTLEETRAWLLAGFALPDAGTTRPMGPYIVIALVCLIVLTGAVFQFLPKTTAPTQQVPLSTYLAAVLFPVLPAGLGAVAVSVGIFGVAAFGGLVAFFAIWGCIACSVLLRAGYRFHRPSAFGIALFLLWSLLVFAGLLDRYVSAFVPTGVRLGLMAALLPAALLFMLADRALAAGAALWRRVLSRALPIATLAGTMLIHPQNMGLLFTVLPVMVLFFLVYGTMGTLVARRLGPETAAVAQAVILAWSLSASTPLFAA